MKSISLFCFLFCFCLSVNAQICQREKHSPDFDYGMFEHYQDREKGTIGKGVLMGALAGVAVAGTVYFISNVYVPKLTDQPYPDHPHFITYGISGLVIGGLGGAIISTIHKKRNITKQG